MRNQPRPDSVFFALTIAAGLFGSTVLSYGQGAVATISDVAVSGGFDYTIILQDTGSTSLNSFWYGWTIVGNNLPSNPGSATNSLGWGNILDGNSIMWKNSSGTALTPGQSGTFGFFSTSTPAQITASPSGESVVYVNGIDFSQGTPGDSSGAFSPTLIAAPEPSVAGLSIVGAMGIWVIRSLKKTRRFHRAGRSDIQPLWPNE